MAKLKETLTNEQKESNKEELGNDEILKIEKKEIEKRELTHYTTLAACCYIYLHGLEAATANYNYTMLSKRLATPACCNGSRESNYITITMYSYHTTAASIASATAVAAAGTTTTTISR